MADSDDDVAHDYESIDDYIPGSQRNRLIAALQIPRDGRPGAVADTTMPRYGELPFRQHSGGNITNSKTGGGDASRMYTSLPRQFVPPSFRRDERPSTGPTTSAPTTPSAITSPSPKLNRSNTFPEGPPEVRRELKPPQRPPKRSSTSIPERKDPIILSDQCFTLSEFCATQSMPKMVRVSAGHYGDCERTSISEGEEFVFYLVKTTLSVPAKPMGAVGDSERFYIPINSLLKVAVIDKLSDTKRKYVYSTLSDLLENRKELPTMVCTVREYYVKSKNTSLPAGTILFLDSKPTKKLFTPQFVTCRTQKNKEFDLLMDCACGFSTHPADVQIHIGEYLTMVNKFPVDIQLYQGDSEEGEDSNEATSSIGMSLTLNKPISQKSIIAKTDVEGTRKDHPITVEIPFDLPIEVQAIARPDEDMDQIYSEVMSLYQNFNQDTVEKSYATATESRLQQQLYKSVRHDYQPMEVPFQLECPNTDYQPLQEVLRAREAYLKEQESKGAEGDEIDRLKEEKRYLEDEIATLRQAKQDYAKLIPSAPETVDSEDYTKLASLDNLKELKSLDVIGVCQLLEHMGLPQYVNKFREEQIDGDLLSELKEEDLADLLVTSSLHKKRLMLLLTGQSSIRKYLDTENPYCTMVRNE